MPIQRDIAVYALVASSGFVARSAQASMPVSVDLDYAVPVRSPEADPGFGGQIRVGPRLDLKVLALDAELGLGAYSFAGSEAPTAYRGVVGTRLGVGWLIRPSVYGHLGVGHVNHPVSSSLTNLTGDVGAALDLTILPLIDVGVHGAYNLIFGSRSIDSFGYAVAGVHITMVLDR